MLVRSIDNNLLWLQSVTCPHISKAHLRFAIHLSSVQGSCGVVTIDVWRTSSGGFSLPVGWILSVRARSSNGSSNTCVLSLLSVLIWSGNKLVNMGMPLYWAIRILVLSTSHIMPIISVDSRWLVNLERSQPLHGPRRLMRWGFVIFT